MKHTELFAAIDALEEEYIRFWADICSLESPTLDKAAVDAVGAFCKAKACQLGWEVTEHQEETSGNALCLTMNPNAPEAAVCFSGHMDTVHPVGNCGTPPVHIEEDRIYGPGARDCKGGIVASFLAMEALSKCGFTRRPIKLILQSDEENSSASSEKRTVEFMARMAQGCVGFFNTESHGDNKATVGRKGIGKYRFDISGKSYHGAKCYMGISAIREAAYKIIELEKWKDEDGLTCNTGIIQGGIGINVVPDRCSFFVDVRFASREQKAWAERELQRIADTSFVEGSTCTLTCVSERVPMEKNEKNMALLGAINEIYGRVGLPELKPTFVNGGSDASDMVYRGIPCIDSMGIEGDLSHNPGEFGYISSLTAAAKRLAAAAAYL